MSENYLNEFASKYEEYLNLNYIKSRLDPEEEPYKTKYEARDILVKLNEQLDGNLSHSLSQFEQWSSQFQVADDVARLKQSYENCYALLDEKCHEKHEMSAKSFLLKKLIEFNLAKNYIETEEIESGERLVAKMVRDITDLITKEGNNTYEYNPLVFNLFLTSLNELVYVWSHRGDYRKCLNLVHTIEELYLNYKESSTLILMPFDPSELICLKRELSDDKRRINFESLYTHSLFYMAQIYGKLDDKEKSAYYCQLTLQRQMDEHYNAVEAEIEEQVLTESDVKLQPQEKVLFNSLDWATHAAALSQYYLSEADFATSRHCLCCAEAILNVLLEKEAERNERLLEQTASIRRCWGKFAIELLKFSKAKLLESTEMADQKSLLAERDKPSHFRFNLPKNVYKIEQSELNAITANIALDFEDARKIFLKAQTILNEAKDFFALDGYVTDHCEIVRDLSELYSALLFFEADLDRRCKMQKRRLDLLIPICSDLSEQFYLQIKRQYLFDIGTINSDLMDMKIELFRERKEKNVKEAASAIHKINTLAANSIEYFESFLNTMKVQPERKVLPDKFDDHNVRPALLAKFYIGRLHSKMITGEPGKRLANVKSTFDNYSYLVNYCEKHANNNDTSFDVMSSMKVEYEICKELIVFMPVQMEKLREQIK